MKVDVLNLKKEKVASLDLNDSLFGVKVKPFLLHNVVRWQLAKRRAGTAKTKVRWEVSGGGKKPWRQKGTGNARAGSNRSPVWVGGGKTFGPVPHSYEHKVNSKVRKSALRGAISAKARKGQLFVLDSLSLSNAKTKEVAGLLRTLGLKGALFIDDANQVFERSVRNIPTVKYLEPAGVNVYDVLRYPSLVVTKAAVEKLEQRLA